MPSMRLIIDMEKSDMKGSTAGIRSMPIPVMVTTKARAEVTSQVRITCAGFARALFAASLKALIGPASRPAERCGASEKKNMQASGPMRGMMIEMNERMT